MTGWRLVVHKLVEFLAAEHCCRTLDVHERQRWAQLPW